jgi:agmatine deiminase
MITDNKTNFLYLANSLQRKFPDFYSSLSKILRDCNIDFSLLPYTKDVWAVDYMPVQVNSNRYVQFVYNPDYLRMSQKWQKTISNVDAICDEIGVVREHSNIILDGGNVIKNEGTVIMCDKVFRENPCIDRADLIIQLHELFEIEKLVFIPQDPEDFTGHADGMVRFIDDKTVIVNNYREDYRPLFQKEFRASLKKAGLEYIELTYGPDETSTESAKGLYINFLEIGNTIIVPTFGIHDFSNRWGIKDECTDDECAVTLLEHIFQNRSIKLIDCNEIAPHGGLLNCISWKIKK